ncbi:MAG: hypothetical protein QM762_14765 [Chryseolinea sp.]
MKRFSIYTLFLAFALVFHSCNESEDTPPDEIELPVARTLEFDGIHPYHCNVYGEYYIPSVFRDSPVFGFCFSSQNHEPTRADQESIVPRTVDPWPIDTWISKGRTLGFIPNRTYYYRAFVAVGGHVVYGDVYSFTPPPGNFSEGTFLDERTGKTYRTVTIEGQTIISDDVIINGKSNFDWFEAQQLAPPGWHVPSKEEMEKLIETLGPGDVAYYALGHRDLVNIPLKEEGRYRDIGWCWTSSKTDDDNYIAFFCMFGRLQVGLPFPTSPPTGRLRVRYFKD